MFRMYAIAITIEGNIFDCWISKMIQSTFVFCSVCYRMLSVCFQLFLCTHCILFAYALMLWPLLKTHCTSTYNLQHMHLFAYCHIVQVCIFIYAMILSTFAFTVYIWYELNAACLHLRKPLYLYARHVSFKQNRKNHLVVLLFMAAIKDKQCVVMLYDTITHMDWGHLSIWIVVL